VEPAGEEEVIRLQASLLDPRLQGIPGGLRDLELNWALGLVLHDDGARRHLVTMTNVSNLQGNEVAATQLAVDAQVEQRELAYPVLHLKLTRSAQMSLSLNGAFCPTILPLFHGSR
jgi:hypothetical protein